MQEDDIYRGARSDALHDQDVRTFRDVSYSLALQQCQIARCTILAGML